MGVLDTSKSQSIKLPDYRFASRPILWLNLLCLDAPLVALIWQHLFARTFSLPLPAAARGVLFLTAWLIYLADRLADSLSIPEEVPKSARQTFCQKHIRFWIALIVGIAVLDAALAFVYLDHETFVLGILLGGIALTYLVVNYFVNDLWRILPIKEIAIGFLFAAGTVIAIVPPLRHTSTMSGPAVLAMLLFGLLCALNCMSIAVWERDLDQAQDRSSIATYWPEIGPYLTMFGLFLAAISGFLAFADHILAQVGFCLGLSALLLLALRFLSISRDERTAMADLVLFTPVLALVAERIW